MAHINVSSERVEKEMETGGKEVGGGETVKGFIQRINKPSYWIEPNGSWFGFDGMHIGDLDWVDKRLDKDLQDFEEPDKFSRISYQEKVDHLIRRGWVRIEVSDVGNEVNIEGYNKRNIEHWLRELGVSEDEANYWILVWNNDRDTIANMFFKSTSMKSGYWISPTGQIGDLMPEQQHSDWITQHLSEDEMNRAMQPGADFYDEVMNIAFGNGWIRVREAGSNMYFMLWNLNNRTFDKIQDFIVHNYGKLRNVDDIVIEEWENNVTTGFQEFNAEEFTSASNYADALLNARKAIAIKGIKEYRTVWMQLIKMWWESGITDTDFILAGSKIVQNHFYEAWKWGIRGTGGSETEAGLSHLYDLTEEEISHIPSMVDQLNNVSDWNGVAPIIDLWVNTYIGIRDQAKVFETPGEVILRWDMGPTMEHCDTCLEYSGKQKTRTEWDELFKQGIYPKSRKLACGGWHCLCKLNVVREEKAIKNIEYPTIQVTSAQAIYLHDARRVGYEYRPSITNNTLTLDPMTMIFLTDRDLYDEPGWDHSDAELRNEVKVVHNILVKAKEELSKNNLTFNYQEETIKSITIKAWWFSPSGQAIYGESHNGMMRNNPRVFGLSDAEIITARDAWGLDKLADQLVNDGWIRIIEVSVMLGIVTADQTPNSLRKVQDSLERSGWDTDIERGAQWHSLRTGNVIQCTIGDIMSASNPREIGYKSKLAVDWAVPRETSQELLLRGIKEKKTFVIPEKVAEELPETHKLTLI